MSTTLAPPRGARPKIRSAALDLLARRGVSGTTTQDIARRAGCSQAAIYKHWESKEALAHQIFEEAHRSLIEAMEGGLKSGRTSSERAIQSLVAVLEFGRKRPQELAFLFQVFHSDYVRWVADLPKPRDIVLGQVEAAMKRGEIPPGDASLKTALLVGMVIRLAFFERQGLVRSGPAPSREGLWRAAAAVLES